MARKAKSFIVQMKSVVIEEYVVTARDESEASEKAMRWEGELSCEVERPDWEVVKVSSND